eukprot:m.227721 g.227721  ORF g.227721 m.227721 type:complete len:63 (+) comp17298_c0_seq1:42-230(+)
MLCIESACVLRSVCLFVCVCVSFLFSHLLLELSMLFGAAYNYCSSLSLWPVVFVTHVFVLMT